jgi:CHAD domain-containing protein
VKKLRYGTDFFASLFTKSRQRKARKRFEKALKTLQDALGKHNDISVHEGLARQFTHPGKRSKKLPQKAFAMGLLAGREASEAHACTLAATKAGRTLVKVPSFW